MFDFHTCKINVWINTAAIGDTICAMPIIKNLIREERINKIISNDAWIELLALYDIPLEMVTFTRRDRNVAFEPDGFVIAPLYLENRAPYRTHLIDFFSYEVAYAILKNEEKDLTISQDKFIKNPVTAKRYIVLQGGTRERSRTLLPEEWNRIKDHCLSLGLDVVLLGSHFRDNRYDLSGCITDYLDCSLKISTSIIRESLATIAVDGGLVYIAAMTDAPIIAGYTFVDPYYRLPYRHGSIGWRCYAVESRNTCRYCTNALAAYGVTFDKECPRQIDFECVEGLKAEDFIEKINIIVSKYQDISDRL